MPQIQGSAGVITQPVYDTMQLAAAAGPLTYRFFTVPLGQVIAGAVVKTYVHTNMTQAGQLEQGVTLTIKALTMVVKQLATGGAAPTQADYQVIQDGLISLICSDKNWGRFPVTLIPSGGGELVFVSDAAAAPVLQVTKGIPATANKFFLDYPIGLQVQENFAVELLIPGTIAAVTDVQIFLHGDYIRPVN